MHHRRRHRRCGSCRISRTHASSVTSSAMPRRPLVSVLLSPSSCLRPRVHQSVFAFPRCRLPSLNGSLSIPHRLLRLGLRSCGYAVRPERYGGHLKSQHHDHPDLGRRGSVRLVVAELNRKLLLGPDTCSALITPSRHTYGEIYARAPPPAGPAPPYLASPGQAPQGSRLRFVALARGDLPGPLCPGCRRPLLRRHLAGPARRGGRETGGGERWHGLSRRRTSSRLRPTAR